MRDHWPPDYFPRLKEPQKSQCLGIKNRVCASPEGHRAFIDLRFSYFSLGEGWRKPENAEWIVEDKMDFERSSAVIRQIVGQYDLDILLRGLAEDADNDGDMSVYR